MREDGVDAKKTTDEGYCSPQTGGCWICHGEVDIDSPDTSFDLQFDTWIHEECLEALNFDTLTEFERDYSWD